MSGGSRGLKGVRSVDSLSFGDVAVWSIPAPDAGGRDCNGCVVSVCVRASSVQVQVQVQVQGCSGGRRWGSTWRCCSAVGWLCLGHDEGQSCHGASEAARANAHARTKHGQSESPSHANGSCHRAVLVCRSPVGMRGSGVLSALFLPPSSPPLFYRMPSTSKTPSLSPSTAVVPGLRRSPSSPRRCFAARVWL